MAKIELGRKTVQRTEPFVVFLIGARINKWWLLPFALPVLSKMGAMLKELEADPSTGFLGVQNFGVGGMAQYWNSVEELNRYAQDRQREHKPAMVRFFKKLFKPASVGIWHETYLIHPGSYECIYTNMPRFGLGKVAPLVDAEGHLSTAERRMKMQETSETPTAA